jgi:hypothetical protein
MGLDNSCRVDLEIPTTQSYRNTDRTHREISKLGFDVVINLVRTDLAFGDKFSRYPSGKLEGLKSYKLSQSTIMILSIIQKKMVTVLRA